MKKGCCITTYEAAKRAGVGRPHIRRLLEKGVLKGRLAKWKDKATIWLVDVSSVKKFLSSPRKTGPKPKNK